MKNKPKFKAGATVWYIHETSGVTEAVLAYQNSFHGKWKVHDGFSYSLFMAEEFLYKTKKEATEALKEREDRTSNFLRALKRLLKKYDLDLRPTTNSNLGGCIGVKDLKSDSGVYVFDDLSVSRSLKGIK